MAQRIDITYEEPDKSAAPLWTPGDPRDKRVAIKWTPSIGCSIEQRKRSVALTEPPGIPFDEINVAEIHVESRKAFEILRRCLPCEASLLVRILPPVPVTTGCALRYAREIAIVTHGDATEFALAAEIAAGLNHRAIIVSGDDPEVIGASALVVFVHRSAASVAHLRLAIEFAADIVTSDAGAAEEYLSRFAHPGKWHVARSWQAREWLAMIRDLRGDSTSLFGTSAVDVSPFLKPWKGDA
jgi:hypothetical protein